MSNKKSAGQLLYTEQGQKWLAQFEPLDKEIAIKLASSLTLVSHTEFERNLIDLIEETSSQIGGVIALFAVRELKTIQKSEFSAKVPLPFYSQVESKDGKTVSSVGNSSDLGSEARVAHIIRQICKSNSRKFLNHPTIESMRASKCDAVLFVDDFIGSGGRVREFLSSFWLEPTLVSWLSTKHIRFHVVAYSGLESGVQWVSNHKSAPQVAIYRDAPTFDSMPWGKEKTDKVDKLCEKYGRIANKKRKNTWWGFKRGKAALVFEHGCPNNTPAILWEPDFKNSNWIGLFPNRTIDSSTLSVFPSEISRGDPFVILQDVGQTRLAKSGALMRRGETGKIILLVLALIAKGRRKRSTLCFATGLNSQECERVLGRCLKWQFITAQRRLTKRGWAEINAARKSKIEKLSPLDRGSDYYYPRQLRGTSYD